MNRQKPNLQPLRELIALSLVPQLGAHRIWRLLQIADHPQDVFRMTSGELQSIDGIGPTVAGEILQFNDWSKVDDVLEESDKTGACLLTYAHEAYPRLLKEIFDPPVLLWIKGDPAVLDTNGIAVVGTRKASDYGLRTAEQFARALVENGLTVVSGLALGIDASAHRATLDAGGRTVAVLGSGIDNIYPGSHKRLAREIVDKGGVIVSEFPPGTAPDAGNFPVRNRIVSGLTLGTLVVESGVKGGSMITARSALDQNREVFAIPHSLESRNGEGCNTIIRRAWGKLVQSVDDILSEIQVPVMAESERQNAHQVEHRWKSLELDDMATSVCEMLEQSPMHIDELGERLKVPTHRLLAKLLELEMQNCVQQKAGKNFELK